MKAEVLLLVGLLMQRRAAGTGLDAHTQRNFYRKVPAKAATQRAKFTRLDAHKQRCTCLTTSCPAVLRDALCSRA